MRDATRLLRSALTSAMALSGIATFTKPKAATVLLPRHREHKRKNPPPGERRRAEIFSFGKVYRETSLSIGPVNGNPVCRGPVGPGVSIRCRIHSPCPHAVDLRCADPQCAFGSREAIDDIAGCVDRAIWVGDWRQQRQGRQLLNDLRHLVRSRDG